MPSLERESAFFDAHRAEWIGQGHEGEWAVIHGERLLGFYNTLEEGYEAGAREFGAGTFLLKEVTPEDKVETIQRVHWGAGGRQTAI